LKLERQVTAAEAGLSIEQFLRNVLGFSRSMIRRLKRLSGVLLNGQPVILSRRLQDGDRISIALRFDEFTNVLPQPIPIAFVFEDGHILVVNKPPDMLVHPIKYEQENTLANAVLHYYLEKGIEAAFRPISRLDRNTSGLVVIAKHAYAAFRLGQQLSNGGLQREYFAVVHGLIAQEQGLIDLPIARSDDSRVKRKVCPDGKKALTYYTVLKYLTDATFLKLRLGGFKFAGLGRNSHNAQVFNKYGYSQGSKQHGFLIGAPQRPEGHPFHHHADEGCKKHGAQQTGPQG
jgi:23S rRNA pseudouridine1911/1915/1917 synthase